MHDAMPVVRRVKPRVLIVDDQIGRELADALGYYEADIIDSLRELKGIFL